MTTTIKVVSHNYPALVQVLDRSAGEQTEKAPDGAYQVVSERVLKPEDGEQTFYCTTTRMLKITDLEYGDPRGEAPSA